MNSNCSAGTVSDIRRGALIIFEGLDKVGKTVQSSLLLKALKEKHYYAELIQFPNRNTNVGSLINQYLKQNISLDDHAIHLLFSANRWEMFDYMINKLKSGTSLIIDRYAYSGAVYSAAKETLSLKWCKSSDSGLPKPDLVIYLYSKSSINKTDYGKERYENDDFQLKVMKNYEYMKDETWKSYCTDKSIETIHQEILPLVEKTIKNVNNKIEFLWTEDKNCE